MNLSTFTAMGQMDILSEIKSSKRNTIFFIGAIIILFIYLLPHFFKTNSSVFLVHDNLDSNVVWNKVLANDPNVYSLNNKPISGILNSLPSGVYRSEFTYVTLLYYFFSPLTAYNLNAIFIHLIAFFCALIFLNSTFRNNPFTVQIGLSLCWSLLPFRTAAMLSVAALPLIAKIAWDLSKNRNSIKSFIILSIYPFFSDLFLVNTFTLFALVVFAFVHLLRYKRTPKKLLLGITILTISSILVHYKLFELIFIDGFETHRNLTRNSESANLNLKGFIGTSMVTALKGQYHFHTFSYLLTIPIIISGLTFTFRQKPYSRLIVIGGIMLLSIGIANQIWYWAPLSEFMSLFSGIHSYNFRFYSILPFFTFLAIAFCFKDCQKSTVRNLYAHISIMLLAILTFFPFSIEDANGTTYLESPFYTNYIQSDKSQHKSFTEYYKPGVFSGFAQIMPDPIKDVKIACFGFAPSIAQMNGVLTVDGYFGVYSSSYFKNWLTMLNEEVDNNFSSWGNKCYLYSDELLKNPKSQEIQKLKILPNNLKEIGANGILSRISINLIGDRVIEPIEYRTNIKNYEVMYYYPL
jgi:hypothetical protein